MMRFGFKVPHHDTTWTAIRDIWRTGDQLEVFESAWTYDHLIGLRSVGDEIVVAPEKPLLEGWSLLAALAADTSRLRIGTLVTCLPFRHPALLAKIVATVDHISGGRLELGVGAGWMEPESEMFGIELGTTRERLDRLEEGLVVLKGLLSGEVVDHDGDHYRLRGAQISPVPDSSPRIWLGGNGERRTLPMVARHAQAWNYTALRSGGELELFRRKVRILGECCEEIGRDPADVLVTAQLGLGVDAQEFADIAARWADAGAAYVIVMLPEATTPADLEDLATTLAPIAGD